MRSARWRLRPLIGIVVCVALVIGLVPTATAEGRRPAASSGRAAQSASPSGAAGRVYFPPGTILPLAPSHWEVRPSRVVFGVGEHVFLTGVEWESWGRVTPVGVGTLYRSPCKPTCAESPARKYGGPGDAVPIGARRGRQVACIGVTSCCTGRKDPR